MATVLSSIVMDPLLGETFLSPKDFDYLAVIAEFSSAKRA